MKLAEKYNELLRKKIDIAPESGIELNRDYFEDGVTYCKSAEEKVSEPTLFDFMKEVS